VQTILGTLWLVSGYFLLAIVVKRSTKKYPVETIAIYVLLAYGIALLVLAFYDRALTLGVAFVVLLALLIINFNVREIEAVLNDKPSRSTEERQNTPIKQSTDTRSIATNYEKRNPTLPLAIIEKSDRAIHGRANGISSIQTYPSESSFAVPESRPSGVPSSQNVLTGQSKLEREASLVDPDSWVLIDSGKELFNSKTGERLRSDHALGFSIGKAHYILHNKSLTRKISIEDLRLEEQTRPSKT
jgi:hypothetical protein